MAKRPLVGRAPVQDDGLAVGGTIAGRGRQGHDGVGDLLRRDQPFLPRRRERRGQRLLARAAGLGDDPGYGLRGHLGVHEAGAHGVHGDAGARDLRRHRAGEAHQRVLGRGVGREILAAAEPRGRGDVHHPSPVPLDHRGQQGPGAEEGAGGVDRHQPVPVVERGALERHRSGRARVVDQHRDRSQLRGRGAPGASTPVSLVTSHTTARARCPRRLQFGGLALDLVPRARREDHGPAGVGERARGRGADAAACAGHHRDAPARRLTTADPRPPSVRPAPPARGSAQGIDQGARPSSAVASRGQAEVGAGAAGVLEGGLPSRMARERDAGLAGSSARMPSRTRSGRSASTMEVSNRPAWQAPLRNSSPRRSAQGFVVRSGKAIVNPSSSRAR